MLGDKDNVLIFRPACAVAIEPVGFLLHNALVVENVRDAVGWMAAVIVPPVVLLVVFFVTASLYTLLTAGRVVVCERGILKTFAREASTGERGRMLVVGD